MVKKKKDDATTLAVLPAEAKQRIGQLTQAFRSIEPVTIVDETTRAMASEQFARVASLADEIEELFSPAMKAAKEALEAIKRARDEYLTPLRSAERTLRDRIGEWATKQLEAPADVAPVALLEAEDDPFAAAIVGRFSAPSVPAVTRAPVVDENVGLTTRHEWDLVDVALIRPEYLEPPTPNRKAIRALVSAMGTGAVAAVSIDPEKPGISVRKVMVTVRK